jgi:hypothetical protein
MFILRIACGVGVVLLMWQPLVNITFQVAAGQDPDFHLGGNYIMTHRLIYYAYSQVGAEFHDLDRIIDQPVSEFAFSDPWLVGKTKEGWFAIQKQTHAVHYPVVTDQLETITGLTLSSLRMEKDPWPYVIKRPKAVAAKAAATRFCWVLLFVVPTAFGLTPYSWRYILNRRKKGMR